ncbi:hypothetical protein [Streptomyces sp. NPDC051662]|uniref:hypothetical protein n=1 Tax=Streptomyces sp. NPDC051662 TaxID=3154750 RepID=UPI00342AF3B9
MAEAKRTIIEQEVTRVTKVPGITLTLTMEEAETLIAIAAKVGGSRERTVRKHVDSVTNALLMMGARDWTTEDHPFQNITPGSYISFQEKKEPYRWGSRS